MRVGETIASVFTTYSATGAAKNADALPSALLRRGGAVLAGVAVAVTNVGTGRYKAVVTLAQGDGWVPGDCYAVEVSYAMEGSADIPLVVAQGPIIEAAAEEKDYTAARAGKLDHIDQKLDAAGYTAPDNAGIAAAQANTTTLLARLSAARAN